jgi:sulfur carrier protein ThiS
VRVDVILFGVLARRKSMDVPDGSTVENILDALAVPAQERSFLTLDGERVHPDTPVHDGAELRVVVPLGGG